MFLTLKRETFLLFQTSGEIWHHSYRHRVSRDRWHHTSAPTQSLQPNTASTDKLQCADLDTQYVTVRRTNKHWSSNLSPALSCSNRRQCFVYYSKNLLIFLVTGKSFCLLQELFCCSMLLYFILLNDVMHFVTWHKDEDCAYKAHCRILNFNANEYLKTDPFWSLEHDLILDR